MSRSSPICTVAFGARRPRRFGDVAFAAIVFAAPFSAAAVGLGTITQQSALGQSLRVVVPVTLGENEEIPGECFRIGSGTGTAEGPEVSTSGVASPPFEPLGSFGSFDPPEPG